MTQVSLIPFEHRGAPCSAMTATLEVDFKSQAWKLNFSWNREPTMPRLESLTCSKFKIKPQLWEATCFEWFWKKKSTNAYYELNFDPNGHYFIHEFIDYRKPVDHQKIDLNLRLLKVSDDFVTITGEFQEVKFNEDDFSFHLCAVIEDSENHLHYFASHHFEETPNFHDRRLFQDWSNESCSEAKR